MSTILRVFAVAAIAAPVAPLHAQAATSLRDLGPVNATVADHGVIFHRSAWSLTESPDGRFVAFATGDTIRVYDRQTRRTSAIPNAIVGPAELSWSRRGGMISFARSEENGTQVLPWIVPVDAATGRATGPARQISMRPTALLDDAPSFTPDDRFVAFASNTADSGHVVVAPSNGGRERSLYSTAGTVGRALVSPDGRWVYFVAGPYRSARRTLYRVPFNGGRAEPLAEQLNFFIGISADGTRLAWYADGHPRSAATATIVIADTSGKPLGVLRNPRVKSKSWSARPGVLLGGRIEYRGRTHVVPVAGGAVRALGSIGREEMPLGWSPDSRQLLVRRSSDTTAWFLLDQSGALVRRIEAPPVSRVVGEMWESELAWSPDGRFVAYRAESTDGRRLAGRVMLIDVTTGRARTLRELDRVGPMRWRSDGQALHYVDMSGPSQSLVEVTLQGETRTLTAALPAREAALGKPITDSTVLMMTRDSTYLVSSHGAFIRTLGRPSSRVSGILANTLQASRDGRWLAAIEDGRQGSTRPTIQLIPTDGGPSRTLSFDLPYAIYRPYFAGSALVFLGDLRTRPATGHYTDLFAVPLTGGVPRNLTAADSITDLDDIRVSPDGRLAAYSAELGPNFPTRLFDIDVSGAPRNKPGERGR